MAKQARAATQPENVVGEDAEALDIAVDSDDSQAEQERTANAAAELGKLGGAARARKLTPERRAEIARKAAAGRWKKTSISVA